MPVIIFGMVLFAGFNFYAWCALTVLVGAALVFPKKSQKSWEYLPRIIVGAIGYGLIAGMFFAAFPIYYSLQEPSITLNFYFNQFLLDRLRDILEIGGALTFMILLSSLLMVVFKGFYFIAKK